VKPTGAVHLAGDGAQAEIVCYFECGGDELVDLCGCAAAPGAKRLKAHE
jgi:hypothetical protein